MGLAKIVTQPWLAKPWLRMGLAKIVTEPWLSSDTKRESEREREKDRERERESGGATMVSFLGFGEL